MGKSLNMNFVNCVLLVIVLILVVMCYMNKSKEGWEDLPMGLVLEKRKGFGSDIWDDLSYDEQTNRCKQRGERQMETNLRCNTWKS